LQILEILVMYAITCDDTCPLFNVIYKLCILSNQLRDRRQHNYVINMRVKVKNITWFPYLKKYFARLTQILLTLTTTFKGI